MIEWTRQACAGRSKRILNYEVLVILGDGPKYSSFRIQYVPFVEGLYSYMGCNSRESILVSTGSNVSAFRSLKDLRRVVPKLTLRF